MNHEGVIMAEAKAQKKPAKKAAPTTKKVTKKAVTKEEPIEATKKIETAVEATEEKVVAKAGKRSTKAIKEAEEKAAKVERKAAIIIEKPEEKSKKTVNPTRPKLERRSKGYRKVAEKIEKDKEYRLDEAIKLAKETSAVKFDASVEIHINLGVDPKLADQNIRDTVVLPGGTGKTVRVAVFAEEEDVEKAKKAGADVAGSDEFLQQLDKEKINFDVLISTPAVMARLSKYARILGPKGLMPNPKSGTVTKDVTTAVKQAKAGRIEYRVDSYGIIHSTIGKVSFEPSKLIENAKALLASVKANKPASIKGTYMGKVYITTTMGPSVAVNSSEAV